MQCQVSRSGDLGKSDFERALENEAHHVSVPWPFLNGFSGTTARGQGRVRAGYEAIGSGLNVISQSTLLLCKIADQPQTVSFTCSAHLEL